MRNFRYLLALLMPLPAIAGGPPPVSFPQACASTYCIEVLATYPQQPKVIATRFDVATGTEVMTVDLGGGFVAAFSSVYLDSPLTHAPAGETAWKRQGSGATAWSCLKCGVAKGRDALLGVALRGIPASYGASLSGMNVCFWPLDRSTAGYGDGRSMHLGKKTCIK